DGQVLSGNEFSEIQDWFVAQGLTDGLPIVPPTQDAVAEMIDGCSVSGDTEIGQIPPLGATATVSKIAVNAVMAGCKPEHFRTVLTAVRAILPPKFNL